MLDPLFSEFLFIQEFEKLLAKLKRGLALATARQ